MIGDLSPTGKVDELPLVPGVHAVGRNGDAILLRTTVPKEQFGQPSAQKANRIEETMEGRKHYKRKRQDCGGCKGSKFPRSESSNTSSQPIAFLHAQ